MKEELKTSKLESKTLKETVTKREEDLLNSNEKLKTMTKYFGDMLKTTLDKLSEKIEINADEWDDTDTSNFKQRLLDQMNP